MFKNGSIYLRVDFHAFVSIKPNCFNIGNLPGVTVLKPISDKKEYGESEIILMLSLLYKDNICNIRINLKK